MIARCDARLAGCAGQASAMRSTLERRGWRVVLAGELGRTWASALCPVCAVVVLRPTGGSARTTTRMP